MATQDLEFLKLQAAATGRGANLSGHGKLYETICAWEKNPDRVSSALACGGVIAGHLKEVDNLQNRCRKGKHAEEWILLFKASGRRNLVKIGTSGQRKNSWVEGTFLKRDSYPS